MLEILEDLKRIFYCDETAFYMYPKDKQVLVKRGSKKVYCPVTNDEKECLTVLVTIGANGSTEGSTFSFVPTQKVYSLYYYISNAQSIGSREFVVWMDD